MISLKKNRVQLVNLNITIKAIDEIDELIKFFKDPGRMGPAYITVNHYAGEKAELQLNRDVFVDALQWHRVSLVKYLADLGIDANS